jgi:5-methylcytosine-specific restriction protein A
MRSRAAAQAELISKLRYAPGRQWIETYFELARDLLAFTGLLDDDPRLVMSLRRGKIFPITINHRYVLAASTRATPTIGFILEATYSQLPEIRLKALSTWSFDHLRDERTFNTPYFLSFETVPELPDFREEWQQAVMIELERRKTSPYRKYHEPLLYDITVDLALRKAIFDEAFPEVYSDLQ